MLLALKIQTPAKPNQNLCSMISVKLYQAKSVSKVQRMQLLFLFRQAITINDGQGSLKVIPLALQKFLTCMLNLF